MASLTTSEIYKKDGETMTTNNETKHFLQQITLDDMHSEIVREIKTRQRVYPNWIEQGKILQTTADYRILVLEAVALELSALRLKRSPQANLFEDETTDF